MPLARAFPPRDPVEVGEHVRFTGSTGHALAGIVDHPAGEVRGWGVFAHGFTLGKDSPAAARTCRQLASEGIGMLRFDNLGLGESEGEWGDGSFTTRAADTVAAARFLAGRGTLPTLLVGHSFGGAVVLAAAADVEGVAAVATIAAPVSPAHIEHHYDRVVDRALADGCAPWQAGGRSLTIKRAFVEDVRRADVRARLEALTVPVLVMHSPTDDTVEISNAGQIFRAARHSHSFVSLDGTDHLLSGKGDAARVGRIISAWADPYLVPS